MIGIKHLIVVSFGMIGLLLGGVFVDLDHSGTLDCKWRGFWGKNTDDCKGLHRGIFHKPVVGLSIAVFSFCLALGIVIHYMMDYMRFE